MSKEKLRLVISVFVCAIILISLTPSPIIAQTMSPPKKICVINILPVIKGHASSTQSEINRRMAQINKNYDEINKWLKDQNAGVEFSVETIPMEVDAADVINAKLSITPTGINMNNENVMKSILFIEPGKDIGKTSPTRGILNKGVYIAKNRNCFLTFSFDTIHYPVGGGNFAGGVTVPMKLKTACPEAGDSEWLAYSFVPIFPFSPSPSVIDYPDTATVHELVHAVFLLFGWMYTHDRNANGLHHKYEPPNPDTGQYDATHPTSLLSSNNLLANNAAISLVSRILKLSSRQAEWLREAIFGKSKCGDSTPGGAGGSASSTTGTGGGTSSGGSTGTGGGSSGVEKLCSAGGVYDPKSQTCKDDCQAGSYCDAASCACKPKTPASCASGAGFDPAKNSVCQDDCPKTGDNEQYCDITTCLCKRIGE